jgi:hypothetical protein
VDIDEIVFNDLKNLARTFRGDVATVLVWYSDRSLDMIMKKLKLMSSDIDQLKVKAAPRNSFVGLFQANDDTSRGLKRSALLKGNGDTSNATLFVKRKRMESKVNTPAIIMGTGAVSTDLVVVKPTKWLYMSMLHPETTEDSVIKLLSNALGNTQEEFTCVKLLLRNMQTPTFISFNVGMSVDLF